MRNFARRTRHGSLTVSIRQRPPGIAPRLPPEEDDTVRIQLDSKRRGAAGAAEARSPAEAAPAAARPAAPPAFLTSRRAWLAGAGLLGAACLARGLAPLVLPRHHPSAPVPAPPPAPSPAPGPTLRPPAIPIRTAGEQEILHHVSAGLTVFRFADDARILVLDFASLEQQGLMLDRVAALIEKAGTPRNRVLNDAQLTQAIRAGGDTVATYYYGHDYSAESLQRFFADADHQQIRLDPQEATLRRLLHQVGWLLPGKQAGLISIPAVGANAYVTLSARAAILHHELSHGLFFSDPAYAAFVHDFWKSALTPEERAGVRRFLGSEGYDTTDEELMYNEMQAYLMFTRDPEFFTPARVGMTPRRLAILQEQFLRGMPTGWLHDALAATPVQLTDAAPAH
jgi:hypothetical protein